MEKQHQELLDQIGKAQALATAIEKKGGNVQAVIHHLRGAGQLITLRCAAYKDARTEQAEAEAKAKADAEAETKAEPKP